MPVFVRSTEMEPVIETNLLSTAFRSYRGQPFKVALDYSNKEMQFGNGAPVFTIHFRSRAAFIELVVKGDLGFVEAYMDKKITVDGDLVAALALGTNSTFSMPGYWWINHVVGKVYTLLNPDDPKHARENIREHYDLGNEFYSLWLDRNMQYTCAFFAHPDQGLDEAQENKMDYICRKLELEKGMRVLELGSGWGGFAIHAARHYGVHVTAINISHAQTEFARAWAQNEGLADRVTFLEADYRDARGVFDRVVVIGMVEHVGEGRYNELARVVDEHLTDNGISLWHFISRINPKPTDPFSAKYIFPGGHIPALSEVLPAIEQRNLMVLDIDNLRLHYAKTLLHWRKRYLEHWDDVVGMYGERFARMWDLYLAGSIGSFLYGEMTLAQVVLAKGRPRNLLLNRDPYLHPENGVTRWNY